MSGDIRLNIELAALVAGASTVIGNLKPSMVAGVAAVNFDTVNYHKRTVLRYNGLPGGRGAQKMLAARLFGYGRTTKEPTELSEARGESFAVESSTHYGSNFFDTLEHGGTLTTSSRFAVPIGEGAKNVKKFRELLAAKRLQLIPETGLLVLPTQARMLTRNARGAVRWKQTAGVQFEVWGKLVKQIHRRAQLGFVGNFERITPKQLTKYGKILDAAIAASVASSPSNSQELAASRGRLTQYGREAAAVAEQNVGLKAAMASRKAQRTEAKRAARHTVSLLSGELTYKDGGAA